MQQSNLRFACRPAVVLMTLMVAAGVTSSASLGSGGICRAFQGRRNTDLRRLVDDFRLPAQRPCRSSNGALAPLDGTRTTSWRRANRRRCSASCIPCTTQGESMLDTRTLLPSLATVYSDEGGRKRTRRQRSRGTGRCKMRSRPQPVQHRPSQHPEPLKTRWVPSTFSVRCHSRRA